MHTKTLHSVEVTQSDTGHHVEALFATLGVKDHDGDVTVKGAFQQGALTRISAYNHASWNGALPIGKGTIHEEGNDVIFRGTFFNTQAAQDTRETLKGLGELAEWSYGFDVEDSAPGEFDGERVRMLKRMKVHEVSPVLLGAGIGTRTLSVKSALRFGEQGEAVLADLTEFVDRAAEVVAKRSEKGKGLGDESAALAASIQAQLKRLQELLTLPAPTQVDADDLKREYLRFLAITS
ncbi:HK97 family phage prohead protease [Streptomyces sp. NPDC001774]